MWPARNLAVIDCEQDASVLISYRSVGWITSNEKVQRGLGNKTDASSWRQSTNADNPTTAAAARKQKHSAFGRIYC
jgi:hypothetical protein